MQDTELKVADHLIAAREIGLGLARLQATYVSILIVANGPWGKLDCFLHRGTGLWEIQFWTSKILVVFLP